jgi:RNA-directed DNA polymerase
MKRRRNIIVQRYDRQGGICPLCNEPIISLDEANLDHILPKSRGGSNDRENLQLVHRKCNTRKGNRDSIYPTFEVPWEHLKI